MGGEFRRLPRLDAARRQRRHHRLHDAAHGDRPLHQQDALRPGRRRASRRRRHLGRMGGGGQGGRREPGRADRARLGPLRPSPRRPGHLDGREIYRRGRAAGRHRRRLQGNGEPHRQLARGRHDAEGGLGRRRRPDLRGAERGIRQRQCRHVRIRLLADRAVREDDRRRLRLVGDPRALRTGGAAPACRAAPASWRSTTPSIPKRWRA